MSRDLDIPKASPESVARAIFDGVEHGEEEIFPDPMSASLADDWHGGAVKALRARERRRIGAGERPHGRRPLHRSSWTSARRSRSRPSTTYAAWWSGQIEGSTDALGAEFTYTVPEIHCTKYRITELVPGRRVAWHVLDGYLSFAADKEEWTGTHHLRPRRAARRHGGELHARGPCPDRECFVAPMPGATTSAGACAT